MEVVIAMCAFISCTALADMIDDRLSITFHATAIIAAAAVLLYLMLCYATA